LAKKEGAGLFANGHLSDYSVTMDNNVPLSKGYQQLRWKLTLSYTAVTVGALLIVELVLLAGLGLLLVSVDPIFISKV
jgi:hypothetical protein